LSNERVVGDANVRDSQIVTINERHDENKNGPELIIHRLILAFAGQHWLLLYV
jgi:hypothetical protein